MALLSDNGPDFNPSSWIVIFCMGRLWHDIKLDDLILCSYAPRSSRFNPIELVWGTLNQSLAQITPASDANKYNYKTNEEDLKKLVSA